MLTESDRLSRVLSEFIDYSGLRIGAVTSVDVPGVVRDCMALVRQHPDAEGVTFEYTGADVTLPVQGDPDLLHRALFNLLLNASQFAGSGGEVTVSAEDADGRSTPRGRGMGRAVRLTVSDSGPGIESADLERIFDPFFTTRAGGSGLGLAVVHRAVDAHAGAIFVDRAPQGGAQFTIFLPAVDAHDGGGPA